MTTIHPHTFAQRKAAAQLLEQMMGQGYSSPAEIDPNLSLVNLAADSAAKLALKNAAAAGGVFAAFFFSPPVSDFFAFAIVFSNF